MTGKNNVVGASQALFDDFAENYEEACAKGVSLSGESADYFAAGRIAYTANWLAALGAPIPWSAADFGCGMGSSIPHLRRHFPAADLIGLDVSTAAIDKATKTYGDVAKFMSFEEYTAAQDRQFVYCNGVFHHIDPADRNEWVAKILGMLSPGGYFALWENNPWNPGTRMVMRRIPFDRDALPLPSPEAVALLAGSGFDVIGVRFRFYFPRVLSFLRPLERYAERFPLGAQYCVLARKPLVTR